MDQIHSRMTNLQDSFLSLSLQPRQEQLSSHEDRVLLGKLLTTRGFKKFNLVDIIAKTWRTKGRVQVEKLEGNIFKFLFGSLEDKDFIFRAHPWTFNGAHLVLKEWLDSYTIGEISFDASTFNL